MPLKRIAPAIGCDMRADSAAISSAVASRKVAVPVSALRHAARPACGAARRFPHDEMSVFREQVLCARGSGELPPSGNRGSKQRAQRGGAGFEASGSAAADQAQREWQPDIHVACRQRQRAAAEKEPPRKTAQRLRRSERFRLLGREMSRVAPGSAAPRRCGIDERRANALQLQVQRTAQPDQPAADHERVGRHRYSAGWRLRWLIRSSRTPLM